MKTLWTKPVIISAEFLALQNVKLPEKLLLALYAADPAESRPRRALSMTRAGLRKLEHRLVEKGLLIVEGDRRMVRVPDLAYRDRPSVGHFVSDFSTSKKEKNVARQMRSPAHYGLAPLLVPAELLEFRYLPASAKVLLAYYAANPDASNEQVNTTLGISESGLKKLKRSLHQKQVLVPTADGFTIRLPGHLLVRDAQGGHFVPESEAAQNGYKIALPTPKLTPAVGVCKYWMTCINKMHRNPNTTPSHLLSFTTKMIQKITHESPEGPDREAALAVLRAAEDKFYAADVLNSLISACQAKAADWVRTAKAEKLARFRAQVEAMKLTGVPEPKLLGMVTESISQ